MQTRRQNHKRRVMPRKICRCWVEKIADPKKMESFVTFRRPKILVPR